MLNCRLFFSERSFVKAIRFFLVAALLFLLIPSFLAGIGRAGTVVPVYQSGDRVVPPAPTRQQTGLNIYQQSNLAALLAASPVAIDTLRLLAIQVQFTDSLMGGQPGALRTDVRDSTFFANELIHLGQYFDGASRGNLVIEWRVTPKLYNLPNPMGYYGDDDLEEFRQVEMVQTIIDSADADEDFSLYDTFMIIHAGAGQETDTYDNSSVQLYSAFFDRADIDFAYPDSVVFGLQTDDSLGGEPFLVDNFMVVPSDASQDTRYIGTLGIWAFEVGIRLGLLPMFDSEPSGFPDSYGIGDFDLMSYGLFTAAGYVPAFPSAFNRMLAGWVDPIQVDGNGSFRLRDINRPVPGDTACIKIPITESEYYLVVNRVHDANFDSLFTFADLDTNLIPDNTESLAGAEFDFFVNDFTNPFIRKLDPNTGKVRDFTITGSGIYIWHVDENVIRQNIERGDLPNDFASRKGVDLEEADGIQDMDGTSGPFAAGSHFDSFRAGNNDRFGSDTKPNSTSNGGARTGITIRDISAADSFMTCVVERSSGYVDTRTRWKAVSRFQPATAFNLDGVGNDELLVLADTGRVYAFDAQGGEFIDRDGLAMTIEPYFTATGAVWMGAPAFGDIDGGGDLEIVAASTAGTVYAWKGDSTEVADGDGNPLTNGVLYQGTPLAAPPMLVDIDGNGNDDIVIIEHGVDSLVVRFIDGSGNTVVPANPMIASMYPVTIPAQHCAPPAYGAVGRQGRDTEGIVVVWADTIEATYGISYLPTRLRSGTAFDSDEQLIPSDGPVRAVFPPLSAPAVGDLNNDGFEEVIVTIPDGRLVIFAPNMAFGAQSIAASSPPSSPIRMRSVPLRSQNPSAPALGDVDGNGTLEIALYDDDYFYVFENNGRLRTNWPQPVRSNSLGEFPKLTFERSLTSPLIGDIDGNGSPEIVFPALDGTVYVLDRDGATVAPFPRVGPSGLGATPWIGDIDNDSELELVLLGAPGLMATVDAVSDSIVTDDTLVLSIQSLPGSTTQAALFWSMYQQGPERQGRLVQTGAPQQASQLTEPNSFIIYPNPARDDQVHARILLNQSATVGVEIYNLEGEKAISQDFYFGNSGGAIQTPFDEIIDVKKLSPGVYMMRLSVASSAGSQSFVKNFAIVK